MAVVTTEIVYKDFDMRFIPHPVTGKLILRKNDESIKQALKNLILTDLGERRYRPLFGSTVRRSLFENYTSFTEDNIRRAIKTAIKNYEQRVQLLDIIFTGDPDKNELNIAVVFRSNNATEATTLNLSVERVR